MRLLPVYFPYDPSSCCSRQELTQKAQEFILCTSNINDCRVLFLHNTGDVPPNACWVHAVLLVMLHLTDTPGDTPAVFIIAENAFLACLCESGADIAQFYDGNVDAVGFDFICQCTNFPAAVLLIPDAAIVVSVMIGSPRRIASFAFSIAPSVIVRVSL